MHDDLIHEIEDRAATAAARYGAFASSHEALGVALEEWDELRLAVHVNDLQSIERECIDLAAVLFRLARACHNGGAFAERSSK
jgi:hypothetical protein